MKSAKKIANIASKIFLVSIHNLVHYFFHIANDDKNKYMDLHKH